MCKNIIYNYTLLVTNIRLFIRQTKKHTLFNAFRHRNIGMSRSYLAHVKFRVYAIFNKTRPFLKKKRKM